MSKFEFKVGDRVNVGGTTGTISAFERSVFTGEMIATVEYDGGGSGVWHPRNLRPAVVENKPTTELYKQKAGKPRWSIILGPVGEALKKVIEVREYGIKKYASSGDPNSWQKVSSEDYADSAVRHLQAYLSGHKRNAEDGDLYHLAQAAIDCLFALSNDLRDAKS